MKDELTLIASKKDYQELIDEVDAQMNDLLHISEEYEQLKANVSTFYETDDNMTQMQNTVQENVNAVQEAIGMCKLTKSNIQKTVDEMDLTQQNISSIIEDGAAAIKSSVKSAIHAECYFNGKAQFSQQTGHMCS